MADADGPPLKSEAGEVAPSRKPRRIALAVHVVALALLEGSLRVLLVHRASRGGTREPAIPGVLVEAEESLEVAARRALREETGLPLEPSHLEQSRAYGDPAREEGRDRRVVSVAYLAVLRVPAEPGAKTDDHESLWKPVAPILAGDIRLASDHAVMVSDAIERLHHELEHTAVATAFLGSFFTEAELRSVYETVWGVRRSRGHVRLDAPNFHRALTSLSPPIVQLVGTQVATGGRPAALYRPSDHVRERGPSAPVERPIPAPRTAPARRRVH